MNKVNKIEPEVSIIVPIFNGEKYVEKCIKNLNSQTFKDFEIVFINDGSSDSTLSLLKKYKQKNMNIISKKNAGVSAARNDGIKYSKGQYLAFLDVDDEYEPAFLEIMLNRLKEEQADCAICNYVEVIKNKKIYKNLEINKACLDSNDIQDKIINRMIFPINKSENSIWGTVWRIVVKKETIEKLNLTFDENTAYSEDLLFLIELFSNIKKLAIVKDYIYKYYRSQGSALNKYVENYYQKNMYIHKKLVELLKKSNLYDKYKTRYLKNKFRMYTVIISNAVRNSDRIKGMEEISVLLNDFIDEFRDILPYMSVTEKICYFLIKLKLKKLLYITFYIKEKIRTRKFYE